MEWVPSPTWAAVAGCRPAQADPGRGVRWDIRLEPTFGERFDPDVSKVVEGVHLSSISVMVGWGWGIGSRLPSQKAIAAV